MKPSDPTPSFRRLYTPHFAEQPDFIAARRRGIRFLLAGGLLLAAAIRIYQVW